MTLYLHQNNTTPSLQYCDYNQVAQHQLCENMLIQLWQISQLHISDLLNYYTLLRQGCEWQAQARNQWAAEFPANTHLFFSLGSSSAGGANCAILIGNTIDHHHYEWGGITISCLSLFMSMVKIYCFIESEIPPFQPINQNWTFFPETMTKPACGICEWLTVEFNMDKHCVLFHCSWANWERNLFLALSRQSMFDCDET